MNKTQDVILGVLSGPQYIMKYPGIEAYVVSIKRSGFSGRKVMLSWNIHPQTRAILVSHGFEVVDIHPWPSEPFFHARVRLVAEYLKEHHKEFRNVLWLDIKDLILQSDPSVWLEDNMGRSTIIGSNECVTIAQEETNQLWAKCILGEKKYQEIKNCEVINGGTFAGEAEAMSDVFQEVHLLCKEYFGPYPPCQISMNYVMHTMFKNEVYIPRWEKGFAACLHPIWSPWRVPCWPYLKDKHPVLDLDTCILYPGIMPNEENVGWVSFTERWGKDVRINFTTSPIGPLCGVECVKSPNRQSFSIIHGYDRDWMLKEMFEYKYRLDGDFNFSDFMRSNEERLERAPAQRRGLRRPKIENSHSDSIVPQSSRIFHRHS